MKKIFFILSMTILLGACHNQVDDSHAGHAHDPADKAHSHEEDVAVADSRETEFITLYNEKLEVYIEFQQLFVGQPSDFMIHVTRLDSSYSAYAGRTVDMLLNMDGFAKFKSAENIGVQGVFLAQLVPENKGMAELSFSIQINGTEQKLTADHVHIYDKNDEIHHHGSEDAGLTKFAKEQAWNSRFNVIPVKSDSFSRVITASGELMAMPGEKQNVIAKSQGIVLFETRNLVQGHYVNKGEVLFTLSGKGLADNNIRVRFNEAQTNFSISKASFIRHKQLLSEQVISEKQFLQTENQYINDSIMYYSLKETVEDDGMKIKAPRSGYIHEMNVSEGVFVEPGELMATISTNKVILLRADVPQQYFNLLGDITTTHFRPAYTSRVYTMEELSGKLIARGASVAENNHYMPVYFEVVNDGSLLEGAFAEFYLKTKAEPSHIVIPASALIEEQGNYYVYVQKDGVSYQKKNVILAGYDGKQASILSGLKPGERLVSEGAMLLKTASSAAIPSHAHQH